MLIEEESAVDNQENLPEADNQPEPTKEDEQEVPPTEETVPSKEEAPTEETKPAKPYYTAEEMRALSLNEVDTSRIPPEQQPFYKAMLSSFRRKTEDVAREREGVEEARRRDASAQPKTLRERYFRDPEGTEALFAKEIAKLQEEDPFGSKAQELRDIRDGLRFAHNQAKNEERDFRDWVSNVRLATNAALEEIIPGFGGRIPVLNDFVISESGKEPFTTEEIGLITDPASIIIGADGKRNALGPIAKKIAVFVNSLYEKVGKSPQVERQKPTRVESAGGEVSRKSASLEALYNKAMETGTTEDWGAYLEAKKATKKATTPS